VAEGFTCEVEYYGSACKRLDFSGEYEGKRYCVCCTFPAPINK
jgi:hypothetical protein